MQGFIRAVDGITAFVGKTISWLTLAMVLITTYLVVMRYVFRVNSIALQEVVMYMHAAVFMLGAAWALQTNAHVRVDIFYRKFSAQKKAVADIIGTVFFLLPFAVLVGYYGYKYASGSWAQHEGSPQAGGLPYVYLLKSLLPAFAGLILIQGIAELLRNILILSGKMILPEEE
ncbi:TRAP transporter small permease subunit [Suttonella ornithocola]|uniref:TRAP transporter small permease protein n=1 Tax=Suttonella ornithocola TaxID=279832 RepID=A0A380MLH1_9GAMM|nr:TRAP transporter small permease subunit [Suttonella ornithocola]SUO93489.1 TRAP-type mannitol/chloroaromatic compound transport system, small permease component [Suttonella ornithocola]